MLLLGLTGVYRFKGKHAEMSPARWKTDVCELFEINQSITSLFSLTGAFVSGMSSQGHPFVESRCGVGLEDGTFDVRGDRVGCNAIA